MSLQLTVACAVVNERGELLLSLREDMRFWNLPGGHLDEGETLAQAAVREVFEETGILVAIDRAVGLYFWPGFRQVTTLFSGRVAGGDLLPRTEESAENRFFPSDRLPEMPRAIIAHDALAGTRHLPRELEISASERRRLRRALCWRRFRNRLRGRPESEPVELETHAVGVGLEEGARRVLTLSRRRTEALPRVVCSGERSPWDELSAHVRDEAGIDVVWRWVGLWEAVEQRRVDFVFAATMPEWSELEGRAQWATTRNSALPARETIYVSRVRPTFAFDPVWMIGHEELSRAGDTILWNKETYR